MLSGCPGQIDFPVGQVTFHSHLANGQGPRQVVCQLVQRAAPQCFRVIACSVDLNEFVCFQMELDSKDLMIDRLNSQIKQRPLNTSINDDDPLSVSGTTVREVVGSNPGRTNTQGL